MFVHSITFIIIDHMCMYYSNNIHWYIKLIINNMAATVPVKRTPFTLRCIIIILHGSNLLSLFAVIATWYTFQFTIQQQQSLPIVYLVFAVLITIFYLLLIIVLHLIERKLRSEEPSCCYGLYYYPYYDQC